MIIKKHIRDGNLVIALCDEDLLGKTFEEGTMTLDLTSPFYQGEPADPDSLPDALNIAAAIIAAGNETLEYLKGQGFINDPASIKTVENIPFTQIFSM